MAAVWRGEGGTQCWIAEGEDRYVSGDGRFRLRRIAARGNGYWVLEDMEQDTLRRYETERAARIAFALDGAEAAA
jgi:hypothetical protein